MEQDYWVGLAGLLRSKISGLEYFSVRHFDAALRPLCGGGDAADEILAELDELGVQNIGYGGYTLRDYVERRLQDRANRAEPRFGYAFRRSPDAPVNVFDGDHVLAPAHRWRNPDGSEGGVVASGAVVAPGTWIAPGAEIRPGAYVRSWCLIWRDPGLGVVDERVRIGADSLVMDGAYVDGWTRVGARCVVGCYATLGYGSSVADGIVLGEGEFVPRGHHLRPETESHPPPSAAAEPA